MSTITTVISLDSSNLFPNPLKINLKNVLTINENTVLTTNDLQPSANEILLETDTQSGDSGIIYLYCASASTNSNFGIDIITTHTVNNESVTTTIARLLPGSFIFVPVYAAAANGLRVNIKNNDPVNPATLTYLYGSKD